MHQNMHLIIISKLFSKFLLIMSKKWSLNCISHEIGQIKKMKSVAHKAEAEPVDELDKPSQEWDDSLLLIKLVLIDYYKTTNLTTITNM